MRKAPWIRALLQKLFAKSQTPSAKNTAADVDWLCEAIRCRSSDLGLVPVGLIRRLTKDQWSKIRMMRQAEARRLMARYNSVDKATRHAE